MEIISYVIMELILVTYTNITFTIYTLCAYRHQIFLNIEIFIIFNYKIFTLLLRYIFIFSKIFLSLIIL